MQTIPWWIIQMKTVAKNGFDLYRRIFAQSGDNHEVTYYSRKVI